MNSKDLQLIIVLTFIFPFALLSQKQEEKQPFFTGVSPVILNKDDLEINVLNTLTSFWIADKQFGSSTEVSKVVNLYRYTRNEQLLRLTYGFSQSKRWDLAGEFRIAQARYDDDARSSPFNVLNKSANITGTNYSGLTYLGLRARFMPFERAPELTAYATYQLNMPKDSFKSIYLDAQRQQASIGATYYHQSNENTYYFFQGEWNTRFPSPQKRIYSHIVSGVFAMIFDIWSEKLYVYPNISYTMNLQQLQTGGNMRRINQQLFGGAGVSFQPNSSLSFIINFNIPFIFESGDQNFEWIRQSYNSFTLGIRSQF
jgi:hypothetical protein